MLRLRVLTAVIGVPLVVLSVILGPYPFGIFLCVVAAFCTYELGSLAPGLTRVDVLVVIAIAWSMVLACVWLLPLSTPLLSLLVTLPVVVSLIVLLGPMGGNRTFAQWSWTMAGAVYVGWLLGHWGGLYVLSGGRDLVFFGIFTTFFYDTFAFFTGRAVGRHKMAPHLSAGKTWEGAVGGLLMAVIGGLLMRLVFLGLSGTFAFSAPVTALCAVCIALAAQVGDLVESALKRNAGVKDAGGILPGHGGMLDRFDSLLFVGPMLYYITLWVSA